MALVVFDWSGPSARRGALALGVLAATALLVLGIGMGDALGVAWPLRLVRDAALAGMLTVAAAGWGRLSLRALSQPRAGRLVEVSLGLAVLGPALLGLGALGRVSRPTLAAVLAAGCLAAAAVRHPEGSKLDAPVEVPWQWQEWALAGGVAAALAVSLTGSLVPETFFDALNYHTAMPARFVEIGRTAPFAYVVHSAMPSHTHLLYMPLLAWGGASTVKLAHWLFLVGSAAWLWRLGVRFGGRLAGAAASLVFVAVPGVGLIASFGGIDIGVVFFGLGAVVVGATHLEGHWDPKRLAVAALLMGAACGTKYSALAIGAGWGVALVIAPLVHRQGWRRAAGAGLLAAGGLLVVAGPWYLRNWVTFGTPVYPLLSPVGSAGAMVAANLEADSPAVEGWSGLPNLLVDAAFERRPLGGGAEVWPLSLLLVAAVALALAVPGLPRWLGALALLSGLLWARTLPVLRYAFPSLAVAAAACGLVVGEARRAWMRIAVTILLLLAGGLAIARQLAVQQGLSGGTWQYLLMRESARQYLGARLAHFDAAGWVSTHLPARGTRLLLLGETLGYYFRRDYVPVSGYSRHPLVAWVSECTDSDELRRLLQRRGFTHFVVNPGELVRLQAKYRHLPLDRRGSKVLADLLRQCTRVYDDGRILVLALQ